MIFEKKGSHLILKDVKVPVPNEYEVLIKVKTCGVCRTDLHILEGDLPSPKLPLILGHQIVGCIEKIGSEFSGYEVGDRVGITWLGSSCKNCEFCLSMRENLCDKGMFTGYDCNGGYAEYCIARADVLVKIPSKYNDLKAAPLLCSGVIGYRAFRLAQPFQNIGFYGFGSSAHLLIQVARFLKKEVYVFTKPNDEKGQEYARSLGATWAGGSDELPPVLLDAAILFAPVGNLFIKALEAIKKGGRVISAGICMSDIPSFPYSLLWEERSISSVANVTRQDALEFMEMAQKIDLNIQVMAFPLEKANEALLALKKGDVEGSIVLRVDL